MSDVKSARERARPAGSAVPALPRRLLSEAVGTALLVTVVLGSGIAAQNLSPGQVGLQLLENSLATAFGLTVLILQFGPVSGAHFNPVVSLADWALGRSAGHGLPLRDVGAPAQPPFRRSPSTARDLPPEKGITVVKSPTGTPSVLFVCIHNAGRSQMAAGWLSALAGGDIEVRSAGTAPADQVNPVAVDAMREVGIDITTATPKILTPEAVQVSDVVITMGCGDTCPFFPGTRYLDWPLDDPAGQGIDAVRPIRDAIKAKVEALIAELLPDRASA
jgi:arsenate reductase